MGKYISIKESVSRNELNKLIVDADYVVIPSIAEGFGFSAVEACDLGKSVIYSNGGSLPEVVFGNCLEFENRSAMDLAQKLLSVIQFGDSAFSVIPPKTFEESRMLEELIALYDKCLETR